MKTTEKQKEILINRIFEIIGDAEKQDKRLRDNLISELIIGHMICREELTLKAGS